MTFTVEVISQDEHTQQRCSVDEITTDFTVDDVISYEIGISEKVTIAPTWAPSTVQDCPSEYVVLLLVNSEETRELTAPEAALVKLDTSNGHV